MNSSLNISMISNASSMSSISSVTSRVGKKQKDESKNYLQTWSVFYKEFDEDRFQKAQISPNFTRASIPQYPSIPGIDRRFVALFYAWIERYFLNFQMRNITAIFNTVSSSGNGGTTTTTESNDDRKIAKAKSFIENLIQIFNMISLEEFSLSRFSSLHEELLRLIGWKRTQDFDDDTSLVDSFTAFAFVFYKKKYNDTALAAQKQSGSEWNFGSLPTFLEKFDKDKALVVSTWFKMPVKVLVAKPEKIQLLCDKNGGTKESATKIDKSILLVEDFSTGIVHIGYDCPIERLYRFCVQAKAIADEERISRSAIVKSDELSYVNSQLVDRVSNDCQVSRERQEALTTQLFMQFEMMKRIFSEMSASWLKTLGVMKNYILPAVGMGIPKKQAFLDTIDAQAEILGFASLSFGTNTEKLQEIHSKYHVRHELALEYAMTLQKTDEEKQKKQSNGAEGVSPPIVVQDVQIIPKKIGSSPVTTSSTSSSKSTSAMILEQLIYSQLHDDTSQWTIKDVLNEARNNISQAECAICCETKKSNEFWYAKCTHVYCFDCLKEHIAQRVAEGKRALSDLTCCMCALALESKELYAILPANIKIKIDEYYANKILNFTCPNEKCGMLSYINEKTLVLSEGFITNCCGQHVCSKCKGKVHESKRCPSQVKELIDSVQTFRDAQDTDAGRIFRFCPICSQLAFKDAGCNHVKCTKCKTEFCFQCSAPRQPILGHGNHYHRKGCPDFAEYIHQKTKKPVDLEFDKKKCAACAISKKPCKRPPEWNDFNTALIENIGVEIFNAFPDNFIL